MLGLGQATKPRGSAHGRPPIRPAVRLRAAARAQPAGAGGALRGAAQVQLRRRPHRPRARARRRPDRGGDGSPEARGPHALHLWAAQRAARLPAAARVPGQEAQELRRHRLHGGRDPDHLGLAAGARPRQRAAAGEGRHGAGRGGQLRRHAVPAHAHRRQRHRRAAGPGRHAHGCACRRAGGLPAPGHQAEVHLRRSRR